MPTRSKPKTLSGRLEQLLFSPKGGVEGLLLTVRDQPLQVSMEPATGDPGMLARAVGQSIEVTAVPDHSPKTREAAHPVFKLSAINKVAGKAVKSNGERRDRVSGIVASIHYAKHGEPNGVILDSGEFVHTRPHGMKELKLHVGSKVEARGERRMTALGTGMIEARRVNRVTIK
jgi:hypothetical protein